MRPSESFNRTNVTELGLESLEQKPELLFDPERDLTKDDWSAITEHVHAARQNKDRFLHLYLAYLTHLGRPVTDLTSRDWSTVLKPMRQAKKSNNFFDLSYYAADVATIDRRKLGFSPAELSDVSRHFDEVRSQLTSEVLLDNAYQLAVIQGTAPTLTPEEWRGIDDVVTRMQAKGDAEAIGFARYVAKISVLDPARIHLNQEDWQEMRAGLEIFRQKRDMSAFEEQATHMTMIARNISPATTLDAASPPMPETKSYTS